MFKWSNWLNFKNCDMSYFLVNWLGVEKESLLTECTYKPEVSKVDRYL